MKRTNTACTVMLALIVSLYAVQAIMGVLSIIQKGLMQ